MARRRELVTEYQSEFRISERRGCQLLGICRSSQRYRHKRDPQNALRRRIKELAESRPRWGYRRLHILLQREGWTINHKRVRRLYNLEGLQVPVKRRKKLVSLARGPQELPGKRNDRWAIDFVHDRLTDGRSIRALTVVDVFSRECVGIEVNYRLTSAHVTEALNHFIKKRRAKPRAITLDNGTEFRSHVFDAWAYGRSIELDFTQPGKPVQKAFIESFNGSLRDECLNTNWFDDLEQARILIEKWRIDYNDVRPHSFLGHLPPAAYKAAGA